MPFWDLYWCAPATSENVGAQITAIFALPWQLHPTLLTQLVMRTSVLHPIEDVQFSSLDWLPKLVDQCLESRMFTLAARALMIPLRGYMPYRNSQARRFSLLTHAITVAREKIPCSHWGEVVDEVARSWRCGDAGPWGDEDERLAFLEAFFSADDAAWITPLKSTPFIDDLVSMWYRLPDRSDGETNRFDAFCAKFTLDRESRVTLKTKLGV